MPDADDSKDQRVVVIGEGMIELTTEGSAWRLGHGGDALNTAVHLARLGNDVALMTALGSDSFSTRLRADWAAEGIDTAMILTDPERQAGLYAISNDAAGERSFTYWRGDSAARRLFDLDGIDAALATAARADLLYFSLVTLAILPEHARRALLALAAHIRARGGRVAFDGNYRPRLWSSREEAQAACATAIACADIGLPTLEDERALWGGGDADGVAMRWATLGNRETIVKLGAAGCRLPDGTTLPPPARVTPVDTSGAGDAFNAGYLHARLGGAEPGAAAMIGHHLAGWTITRPGAIPARTSDAPYGSWRTSRRENDEAQSM